MSFLDEIKKKKLKLSHTETIIKDVNGTVYVEDLQKGSREFFSTSFGYVVDTKPDLKVARVLPGLIMGSQDITSLPSLLVEHGITHILSLGVEIQQLEGFTYTFVEILDLPESSIVDIFKDCFKLIDSIREKEQTIYVHCNAGVSRSASLVIGYVMKTCRMSFKEAHDYLKSLRPSIKPNEGFIKQLLLYEKSLGKS